MLFMGIIGKHWGKITFFIGLSIALIGLHSQSDQTTYFGLAVMAIGIIGPMLEWIVAPENPKRK